MKIFLRIVAVYLIASSLFQAFFNDTSHLLAAHPEFHWLVTTARVLGWLLLPVSVWMGIRLWRHAGSSDETRSRKRANKLAEAKTL